MASIKQRINKRGESTWQLMVRMAGIKPIFQTHLSRESAEEAAAEIERQIQKERSRRFDPASTLPPSGYLGDEPLLKTISMFSKSRKCIKRHVPIIATLKKHVGNVLIRDLDQDWISGYIAKLQRKNSRRGKPFCAATGVGHVVMINTVLKWRAAELKMPKPTFTVDAKTLPAGWDSPRKRRLRAGEERTIMKHMRAKSKHYERYRQLNYQYRLLFRLALETGARLQELVRADWKEIDFEEVMWYLPAAHTKCRKDREVPLSPIAFRIIRLLHRMRDPNATRIFHLLGTPADASNWYRKLFKSAGLVDFRFHDTRHEAITRFVLHPEKYPVPYLMQIVGHEDYEMFGRYITFRANEMKNFMARK